MKRRKFSDYLAIQLPDTGTRVKYFQFDYFALNDKRE